LDEWCSVLQKVVLFLVLVWSRASAEAYETAPYLAALWESAVMMITRLVSTSRTLQTQIQCVANDSAVQCRKNKTDNSVQPSLVTFRPSD
jgi:hypothetical protein